MAGSRNRRCSVSCLGLSSDREEQPCSREEFTSFFWQRWLSAVTRLPIPTSRRRGPHRADLGRRPRLGGPRLLRRRFARDAESRLPQASDGVDLTPLLNDPAAKLERDALFFHYPHYYHNTTPVGAIRARDWKLLEYFEDDHVELYNLAKDLSEQHDLAAKMPAKTDELRQRLHTWREAVDAAMPKLNPDFREKTVSSATLGFVLRAR